MERDTIVAISTPPGRGGIGVVRLSGAESREIARTLLQSADFSPGRAHFSRIVDSGGRVLDECVVTFFAAPHSYTSEDVVELSLHGAPVILDWVARACVGRGARPARAGEFTERAFFSGRLDLTQAEAVRDLIDSTTMEQARVSAQQLGGALAAEVRPFKQQLMHLIGELEAGIDFAEDDISVMPQERVAAALAELHAPLAKLAASFRYGRVLRAGISLAIAGRPNAGKSSLFNRLVERDRAIVTSTPGTTRDLVSETISLGGVPLHLVDTAGLRHTEEEAESLGIAKSREALAEAELALLVLDATQPLNDEEKALLADENLSPRIIAVRNKVDLLDRDHAPEAPRDAIPVSALTGEGMAELRDFLKRRIAGEDQTGATLTNIRQQAAVQRALTAVEAAQQGLSGLPHEVLLVELYNALAALDELTGQTTPDDILAFIFSTFCIGK